MSTSRTREKADGELFKSTGIDDNATSTAVTIDASENVGIGTSSPARELDIVGNANVSGGYYANNASGTFLWNTANAPIAFGTNNAQRMTINAAGNVGIGVTPEAWSSIYAVQQIGGTGAQWSHYNQVAGAIFDQGQNMYRDASAEKYIVTDEASKYRQYSGKHIFSVAPSGTADSAISWTNAMTIDNAGIVTKPLQPAFCVTADGSQNNFAINTQVTVTLNNEIIDKNNDFSSNTFTAPVTGSYQLQFSFRVQNVQQSANYYQIKIATSNRPYYSSFWTTRFSNNLDFWTFGNSVLSDMDAGDTAYITITQSGGSAATDIHGESNFSGYLVA